MILFLPNTENDSSWLKAISEFKEKPIIFNYPSSPLVFFQRKGIEFYKKKLICDYVFLISKMILIIGQNQLINQK